MAFYLNSYHNLLKRTTLEILYMQHAKLTKMPRIVKPWLFSKQIAENH